MSAAPPDARPSAPPGGGRFLNPRVAALVPSGTLAVWERVQALKAAGTAVVDLGGGDPDFPTPAHVCQAASDAMARGETHYVSVRGTPALRAAIARKQRRDHGVEVSANDEVLVTPGGKAALYAAFAALVGPGDEVVLPEPAWVSYRAMAELAGATVRSVALGPDDGFRLTREALEAQLTDRSRVLVVCSPSNPTGHLLDAEERALIARVARERDLLVFSDEIYEKIAYDGRRPTSLAALPDLADRTLTFNGFSKAYAMTGWRLGWVAGPAKHLSAVARVLGHMATCATSFTQAGGVAALEGPQDAVARMVEVWARRRSLVCDALGRVPGLRCPRPDGALYVFADVRGTRWPSSVEFTRRLLEARAVAVTPGSAFGAAGEGFVRLALTAPDAELVSAVERIEHFVRST